MLGPASIRRGGALMALGLVLVGCKTPGTAGIDAVGGDEVEADDASAPKDAPEDGSADWAEAGDGPEEQAADATGEDSADDDRQLCAEACAVTAAVVACPTSAARCMQACNRQLTAGRCLPELRVLLRCQATAGPDSYDCSSAGNPTPKPGVCEAESKQDAACTSGDGGTD